MSPFIASFDPYDHIEGQKEREGEMDRRREERVYHHLVRAGRKLGAILGFLWMGSRSFMNP